ncbi:MAG: hypothetical protein LUC97_09355, partial [Clostridiales bacterium]|nr:hypothetical protein [Clostridiales bacterium]
MKLSKLFLGLFIAVLTALMLGCVTAFADDTDTSPSIDVDTMTATIDDSGNVTLTCTINNPVEEQQISIMVAEYTEASGVDFDNPIYLNQYDYDSDAGSFTTTFNVDVSSDKTYVCRVGGTNITTAVYIYISENTAVVINGDVNTDGNVNRSDLILMRRYFAG